MATLTEDDVLEQLDAQDNLFSFMKTAHSILLQGIRQFLPSLFVDNDEEIVEYAVKPLLAQSGPLDDIDVALRLIYALGKMDKWLYADITHFSQYWHYLNEQDETPGFADDMTWDFISNVNSITCNATLYDALKAMKFADFAVWSEARFSGMVQNGADAGSNDHLKGINAVKIELTVNGLNVQAQYHDEEIERVHKPLLRMLAALQTVSPQRRTVVFLCAPPGTGKSTLTTFWEYLAQQDPELPAIQTLPMDGFHHYNSWLDAHQLRPFKGAPETFDVAKLAENLCQVVEGDCTWPQYDRQKHDPVEDALHVTAPLVIVEGNWLLLDDEKWCQLAQFCDFSIFINAPATALRERLVGRKLAGGVSLADAEAFYDRTDGPNVRRVLEESLPANLTLMMTATGEYRLVD